MEEIVKEIKNRTKLRRIAGISLILFGFIFYLIPLVPGTWAIVLGLEILGIRLLVQDKIKERAQRSQLLKKIMHKKDGAN